MTPNNWKYRTCSCSSAEQVDRQAVTIRNQRMENQALKSENEKLKAEIAALKRAEAVRYNPATNRADRNWDGGRRPIDAGLELEG